MLTQSFDHFGGAELLRMCYSYSITSSARSKSTSGIFRPSALAVARLTTSANLVGC